TEQLGEIAAITDEVHSGGDCELDREILARIHLQQRHAQLACDRRNLHGSLAEERTAGRGRPFELMLDDAAHAVDLRAQYRFRIVAAQCGTHDGQRGLEAVSEIAQRVAIASDPLALANEQSIEVRGDPAQLARIAPAEPLAASLLHLVDL